MRTTLPIEINSIQDAEKFLKELNDNGEAYHPEDDAFDIVWNGTEPVENEKTHLNELMDQCYEFGTSFDPCEYLLSLEK